MSTISPLSARSSRPSTLNQSSPSSAPCRSPPGIDIEELRDRPGLQVRRVDVEQAVAGGQHRLDQQAAAELLRQRRGELHQVSITAVIDVGPDPFERVLGAVALVADDETVKVDLEIARRQREALAEIAYRPAVAGKRELVEPPAALGVAREFELFEGAADFARDRGPGAQAGPEIEFDREPLDEHRLRAIGQRQRQVLDSQHRVESIHFAGQAAEADRRVDILRQQVLDLRLEVLDVDHCQAQRPQREREQYDRAGRDAQGYSLQRLHFASIPRLHRHDVIGFLRKVRFHL